jgi:hypothetical protein
MTACGRAPVQRVLRLLVVALVAASCLVTATEAAPSDARPSQAGPTYDNPVLAGRAVNPSIVKAGDGKYYAYLSGFTFYGSQNVMAWSSTDLVNWQVVGNVLPTASAGAWADASQPTNFTSPSVAYLSSNPAASRYVLYFTGVSAGAGTKCIGVATAAAPSGPFTGKATPLVCPEGGAKDPSVPTVPGLTGYQQLVYVKTGSNPGIYGQVLAGDGQSLLAGWSPTLLYTANPGWWHGGVVERPALLITGARAYLLFAGGADGSAGRAFGWAPCRANPYYGMLESCRNQAQFGSFLAGNAQLSGLNGPQVFSDGTHQWLAYSGKTCTGGTCSGTPELRIEKLCVAHGWLRTNGPTVDPEPLARDVNCSLDIPGEDLTVASVADDGTTVPVPLDGNVSGAAGGTTVWAFGDAGACGDNPNITNVGGRGQPGRTAAGPQQVDATRVGTCYQEVVPHTAEEVAYDTAHWCDPAQGGLCDWSRTINWPSGVVGTPDGGALVFFNKGINSCLVAGCWGSTTIGTGVVKVSAANVAAGTIVADRSAAASPAGCNPTCLFTHDPANPDPGRLFSRPMVDGDYVYAYSHATEDDVPTLRVARALLADAQNTGAWQYWNSSDWDGTAPGQPLTRQGTQYAVHSVSYNPYLDKYLAMEWIWADPYVSLADDPTGPWSPPVKLHETVACAGAPSELGYWPRTPFIHAELSTNGGRSLALSYARPGYQSCPSQQRWATVNLE